VQIGVCDCVELRFNSQLRGPFQSEIANQASDVPFIISYAEILRRRESNVLEKRAIEFDGLHKENMVIVVTRPRLRQPDEAAFHGSRDSEGGTFNHPQVAWVDLLINLRPVLAVDRTLQDPGLQMAPANCVVRRADEDFTP
jgi:hypothetical protein